MNKKVLVLTTLFIVSELIGKSIIYALVVIALLYYFWKYGISKKVIKINSQLLIILMFGIIVYGIGSDIYNYGTRDIIRDIYRFSLPIVFITFGYYLTERKKVDLIYIYSAIVYSAIFISLRHLLILLMSLSDVLKNGTRFVGGGGSGITVLGFIILCFLDRDKIQSIIKNKKVRLFLVLLFLSSIFLYSSRTTIVSLASFICIYLFIKKDIKLISFIKNISKLIIVVSIITLIVPKNSVDFVIHKFGRTFTEISSSGNQPWTWERINNDWRGYEVYRTKIVFTKASALNKVFGFGFGKKLPLGISINLDGVMYSEIPLLHNGYYYLLLKTGMLGVALYIVFMIKVVFKYKLINLCIKDIFEARLLLGIIIWMLLTTYVVTGPYNDTGSFIYSMLIGCMISSLNVQQLGKVATQN